MCDYNRDGDSHRSPWSNEFDPPIDDGTLPSERIRKLEIAANEAFDVYRGLYYEGGVGSTYLWDLESDEFAGVVLLKKGARNPLFATTAGHSTPPLMHIQLTSRSCFARIEKLSGMGQHSRSRDERKGCTSIPLQAYQYRDPTSRERDRCLGTDESEWTHDPASGS